jgi:hypothetical protein
MDIVDRIVERRKPILQVCANYGADNVRIFGSCARDDYDDKSDVDILVHFNNKSDAFNYLQMLDLLKSDLEKILDTKVDILDEDALRGPTRAMIFEEAVAL